MRYLILLPLFLLFGCQGDQPVMQEEQVEEVVLPEEPQPEALTLDEEIDLVRDEYELIVRELEGEVLATDSIEYSCDEAMGKLVFFSDAEDGPRLIINSYSMGDHFGGTAYWYFKDRSPIFLLREEGSWRFGGKLLVSEDGQEYPGTIDKITEDRFYFVGDRLLRHLTKSYEIKSWEEGPSSDQVPNETVTHNGEIPFDYSWLLEANQKRTVDCDGMDME